jgi:hypothetical protein
MIPEEIKQHLYWCVRKEKVPYNPKTGQKAKPNDPSTFGSYEEAAKVVEKYDGFGVCLCEGLSAVDIDHCFTNGELSEMARGIIEHFHSYTEISPSGEGIRILFHSGIITYNKEQYYIKNPGIGVELYISGQTSRYVTVTGDALQDRANIRDVSQSEIDDFAEQYMKRHETKQDKPIKKNTETLDAATVIRKAGEAKNGDKFTALYNGDMSGYPSQSEADQAFCNMLAFWCGQDCSLIDSIFRQSGLYRDKWDEKRGPKPYGQITMERAVSSCIQTYKQKRTDHVCVEPTEEKKTLNTISASELQNKDLPPVRFIVDDFLPQGVTILASPPKYGKSWFVLDLCLSVAKGKPFLNHNTNQCGCLYLALEDSYNRLKNRMNKVLQDAPAPDMFDFSINAEGIENGLINTLDDYISKKPETALIVIDTLQKIRSSAKANEGAYQADYRDVGALKTFADKHGICVMLVHHLRKAADDGDPFNRISGTNGISGAADTSMVLAKKTRADSNTTLSITGRDEDYSDTVLRFSKGLCRWKFVGSLEEQEAAHQKEEYKQNPIVMTVKELLEKNPEGWQGTASDLMVAIAEKTGITTDSPRGISTKLGQIRHLLMAYDKILYEPPQNHKRKHIFSYKKTSLF